jgi:membrane associated rhomboid family serine protease
MATLAMLLTASAALSFGSHPLDRPRAVRLLTGTRTIRAVGMSSRPFGRALPPPPGDDDADANRNRDLESQFAGFKTGGRKLNSWLFRLPGIRSLYLLAGSLRSAARQQLSFLSTAGSALPAYQQFLALNIIVFALQQTVFPTLLLAGARINRLILYHDQLHRLATPMFLHGDIRHLLFNSLSLWNIGSAVESIYGTKRFVLMYFLSGIAGNLAGLEWGGPGPSIGASGSIFGLVGAMLVYVRRTQEQRLNLGPGLSRSLVITIIFGLLPHGRVDQWAHFGGLIGGLAVAAVYAPWKWGRQRSQGSGRGYVIESIDPSPLVPAWVLNASLATVAVAVLIACYYGLDYALMLRQARGWRGVSSATLRRILEQPPRRPGLLQFF